MKILKRGKIENPLYKITCGHCTSELAYNNTDVKYDRDGDYIVCPVCGKFLMHNYRPDIDRSRDC